MNKSLGTLYGIGVGPGDPDLITMKGVKLLQSCRHLFVPKARIKSQSIAYDIAREYISEQTKIHELVFPMVTDKEVLRKKWAESAATIYEVLKTGEDAYFLTLGDSLLYSTYIYLIRALNDLDSNVKIETVPGITAFSHVAALTNFPVGEAKNPVTIIPAADDLTMFEDALEGSGTVVLMKIGSRLENILDVLESKHLLEKSVFVAYAGRDNQWIETDLKKLRGQGEKAGYLSTILIDINGEDA